MTTKQKLPKITLEAFDTVATKQIALQLFFIEADEDQEEDVYAASLILWLAKSSDTNSVPIIIDLDLVMEDLEEIVHKAVETALTFTDHLCNDVLVFDLDGDVVGEFELDEFMSDDCACCPNECPECGSCQSGE
jgi:hypothetical protein